MNTIRHAKDRFSVKTLTIGFAFLWLFLGATKLPAENITNLLREATYAYAQQNYDRALDFYNQAVELETNSFIAYIGRGGAYLRVGQPDKAESDFNKAIDLATNNIPLSYAYLNRGYFYQQTKNSEKAVDDYSKAIQINPSFQSAYANRASVYNSQRRYDLSIIDCNMAIMLNPDEVDAYRYKGDAYYGKREYDKAVEAYSKAISFDTNSSWMYFVRAVAYCGKDDHPHAIKDFDRVIQLQPTNAEAYSYRGLTKSRNGDFKGGIEDCRKGIQLDTNCAVAFNNLAWLLATAPKAKLRDGQKAVEYALRACKLNSWKDAYNLGTLAAAYAEIGNFDEAVKWERKCIIMGLPDKEMEQARKELRLFDQKKPYHADK